MILLLLYPNSTHILQVLDVAIFGPLKLKYSEFYEQWKTLHLNDNFSEMEFIKVLKATDDAVLTPQTIVNGWRTTGLQPFNFNNVNTDVLICKESSSPTDNQPLKDFEVIMTLAADVEDFDDETMGTVEIESMDTAEGLNASIIDIDFEDERGVAEGDIIVLPANFSNEATASTSAVDVNLSNSTWIPHEGEDSNDSTASAGK